MVNERLKLAERREAAARQRLRDLRPVVIGTADTVAKTKSAASKVRKLLSGGTISSTDPAAEVEAALREQDLLHNAQIELAAELRQIIGDISDEFAIAHLGPLVRAGSVEVYEHLARAAAAMTRMRAATADAIKAGYRVSSVSCPDVIPPAGWALGDPASSGSELARMRNMLVAIG